MSEPEVIYTTPENVAELAELRKERAKLNSSRRNVILKAVLWGALSVFLGVMMALTIAAKSEMAMAGFYWGGSIIAAINGIVLGAAYHMEQTAVDLRADILMYNMAKTQSKKD